jgi:hypothetical protein
VGAVYASVARQADSGREPILPTYLFYGAVALASLAARHPAAQVNGTQPTARSGHLADTNLL